ncbi:MAG: hypothetical protein A2Y97_01255 [Nitrospirae bacterium RBG_13_39_12]|nr:MAG: hypothetical protein A2Y97_01255 [Nitrospirae bacterium RBG_13_39_12]
MNEVLLYVHGSYNMLVILLVLYQGWLGMMIRKERPAGRPKVAKNIKRHRNFGPVLALMGILGFFAGVNIVYINYKRLIVYDLHFYTGLVISLLIIATFLISKKIRRSDLFWRTLHFYAGLVIICFYFIQAYIGIRMLLL